MATLSSEYRERAAADRAAAAKTTLPKARERFIASAERLEQLADQTARVEALQVGRNGN